MKKKLFSFAFSRLARQESLMCVVYAVVVGLLLAGSGCGTTSAQAEKGDAAPPAQPAMPPTPVTVAEVQAVDVPVYLDQIGKCASPEIVSVMPQVSGKLVSVHFKEGTDIAKGAPLFDIDPEPYDAALAQAKADLETNRAALALAQAVLPESEAQLHTMQADWEQSKAKQEWNENELKRAQDLLKSNATSQADFDAKRLAVRAGVEQLKSNQATIAKAQAQAAQARASVAVAEAKIKGSLAAIKSAEINLAFTRITSPIAGRAGQRLVDPGNVVNPGTDKPLVVIQRNDPLYVDFTVPENELARVRASLAAGKLEVAVTIPEKPAEPRSGKVFFLDNAVQDATGVIKLRAELKNEDRYFWPGQFVNVRLILETLKNAVLAPNEAVQLGQAGTYVYVVKADQTAELRLVKLGQRFDKRTAILEGLKAGENVVLGGQLMLFPGAKVALPASQPAPQTAPSQTETQPAKAEPQKGAAQ
jgi:multidrug efflux system membrane fusion protein